MKEFRCTYRLQLRPHLDFRKARELVPYLRELGVSHLYLSPSMQARSGSTHGYDVVDPTRLADDLGGEEEFRALCEAGLGVILDVVPNHMAASEEENPFWRDPLTRAKFFDVEWRTGGVRRFFDISDLAGVRVEDPEVFEVTHRKVIQLVREGLLDGIRIDHPDGLANPTRYVHRLREAGIEHVWVEKILEPGEQLRDWPVEGTTGYEFANDVTALFVNPEAEEALTDLYRELTGEERTFEEIALEAKLEQAHDDVRARGRVAATRGSRTSRTSSTCPRALASFPVYRTYVDPDTGEVDGLDRQAVTEARLHSRLAAILLLEERGHDAFVVRFQQTTPPGDGEGRRGHGLLPLQPAGLPQRGRRRAPHASRSRSTTSTPRTWSARGGSRSSSSRRRRTTRSGAATCAPGSAPSRGSPHEWRDRVLDWRQVNAPLRRDGAPDPAEEYLIYQTLVGAWPLPPERLARVPARRRCARRR